jgi:hypothetical protein
MASIGTDVSAQVASLLRATNGVGAQLAALADQTGVAALSLPPEQVLEQSAPASDAVFVERYPAVYVSCEKLTNLQSEKGRRFSGKARMVVECRVSQDRVDGLDASMRLLADAVTEALFQSRGNWTDTMFFGGAYEVQYGTAKHGGKNLLQAAKVTLDVDVSSG